MSVAFIEKIAAAGATRAALSRDDRDALLGLCQDVQLFKARRAIISEGNRPEYAHLILEGWAARYSVVKDGSRQITALLLPGDFCDTHGTLLKEMDHDIGALTDCKVAMVPGDKIRELAEHPVIAHAFWWASLIDLAVARAWIANIGRRDAIDRLGHLLLELHTRLGLVGLTDNGRFELPLTQEVLSDALGLTPVHINRMMQRLRHEGFIRNQKNIIEIIDVKALGRRVGFNAHYLHLDAR